MPSRRNVGGGRNFSSVGSGLGCGEYDSFLIGDLERRRLERLIGDLERRPLRLPEVHRPALRNLPKKPLVFVLAVPSASDSGFWVSFRGSDDAEELSELAVDERLKENSDMVLRDSLGARND